MRILVFFDLPVKSHEDRKTYTAFRKFLLKDGYDMLQFSVYCRLCNGNDAAEKHIRRLKLHLPAKGSVRVMKVTDRQYGHMQVLVGSLTSHEIHVGDLQVLDL